MNDQAPFDTQAGQLWAEILAWLSSHSMQIILGLTAGALIVALLLGVRWVGMRICGSDPTQVHWRTVLGRILAGTRTWFMIALAARLVSGYSGAPETLATTIEVLFVVATTIQVALWARALILGVIEHRAGALEESSGLGSAVGIIRMLVTIAIFIIAVVVVLDNLGVNVTGLVAGLGIGGIAIGLAAQGIFSDLFAALSILLDKPFRRGDTITFGTTTGTVENIGLKSTRVRALTGEEVIISNAKLLEQQVQNWALLDRRRTVMTFGLVYQTAPDLLAGVPLEVKEIVDAQPLGTFDRCHASLFAPSSIDFEAVFFVESPDYHDLMGVRQAVLLGIMRRFAELGIAFAYPTQTSFTAAPDGTLIMPYAPLETDERTESKTTDTR